MVPLNLAGGTGNTFVDEVAQYNERQCQSDHKAPSLLSSGHIDPRITTQMLIFVFALKIFLTGINVTFAPVVGVILNFILGHGITFLVD
jgi:hypothetical protein